MESAYQLQCQQIGVPPHPSFLQSFADSDSRLETNSVSSDLEVLVLGGSSRRTSYNGAQDPPVRDLDIAGVLLTVRSLAQIVVHPPIVRLDLTNSLITCKGVRTIAAVLQVNCGLCSLLLRRTYVADEGAASLGAALGSSSLVELDLGECAISDSGVRLLTRGLSVHGAPALQALSLDGNPFGHSGVFDIISLLEGKQRPSSLLYLSVQLEALGFGAEANGRLARHDHLSSALATACQFAGIELLDQGRPMSIERLCQQSSGGALFGNDDAQVHPFQMGQVALNSRSPNVLGTKTQAHISARSPKKQTKIEYPDSFQNGHLAAWMAGTERELRELKWLLGSSTARLDGQHQRLMSELGKLKGQLDTWVSAAGRSDISSTSGEDARIDLLEARFDALEQLVGREQSECAQMWQLVEVAAGAVSGAQDLGSSMPSA